MKRKNFSDCQKLAQYMMEQAQDGNFTVAVLFYKEANELLRELLYYEDVETDLINIQPYEYSDYDKEYYVTLSDDMFICVEPGYLYDQYLELDADIVLIDNEANTKIISDLEDEKCIEIYIGENKEKKSDTSILNDIEMSLSIVILY